MAMVKITKLFAKTTKQFNVVRTVTSYEFFASDVVASMPPKPMVSTADEGTITSRPFP